LRRETPRLALLVTALLLTACPFSIYQLDRRPVSEPLAEPVLINRPGPLLHEPSGLVFAERYDGFERVTADRYDTAGLHVSIGYNQRRPDCLVVATLYVKPTPRMQFLGASPNTVAAVERSWLEDELSDSIAVIERQHPDLERISLEPATAASAEGALRGAAFVFRDGTDRSELRVFVYQRRWLLKHRFTYAESCRDRAEAELRAFTAQLPWTEPR
jgi:hypothetical protein